MNKLKSIKTWCPCIIIFYWLFLIPITLFKDGVFANDKYKEFTQDLPAKTDFNYYLNALEKAVDFCIRHQLYVDLNLKFGLFLVDVNLKNYLQQKQYNIPATVLFRLEQVLLKTDVLANYFHYMVQKNKHVREYSQDIKITELFYNATTWPIPSDKFNINLLKKTKIYSPEELKKIYGKWETYYNNVNDFEKYKPKPTESDGCIEHLARTPPLKSPAPCLTTPRCKKRMQQGSEFGYGLSHRILFMVIARFSRNCIVFSKTEDKRKTDKYCTKCFSEVQFLALNDFQLPDLMYEYISLCGLFGHAHFFQNSWLKRLIQFQTTEGCFSETKGTGKFDRNQMREGEDDEWKITNPQNIMNKQCNGHFTAVAAATLSQALRYIIETNY